MAEAQEIEESEIVKTLEGSGVVDYMAYLKSPWRIFWSNLLAGVARGFGIILGMTVVLGGVVWFLSRFSGLPLIGDYFSQAEIAIAEYTQQTNYKEEFQSMESLLKDISTSLNRY